MAAHEPRQARHRDAAPGPRPHVDARQRAAARVGDPERAAPAARGSPGPAPAGTVCSTLASSCAQPEDHVVRRRPRPRPSRRPRPARRSSRGACARAAILLRRRVDLLDQPVLAAGRPQRPVGEGQERGGHRQREAAQHAAAAGVHAHDLGSARHPDRPGARGDPGRVRHAEAAGRRPSSAPVTFRVRGVHADDPGTALLGHVQRPARDARCHPARTEAGRRPRPSGAATSTSTSRCAPPSSAQADPPPKTRSTGASGSVDPPGHAVAGGVHERDARAADGEPRLRRARRRPIRPARSATRATAERDRRHAGRDERAPPAACRARSPASAAARRVDQLGAGVVAVRRAPSPWPWRSRRRAPPAARPAGPTARGGRSWRWAYTTASSLSRSNGGAPARHS